MRLVQDQLTPEAMRLWGWRLPFLISIVPGALTIAGHQGRKREPERLDLSRCGIAPLVQVADTHQPSFLSLIKSFTSEPLNLLLAFKDDGA